MRVKKIQGSITSNPRTGQHSVFFRFSRAGLIIALLLLATSCSAGSEKAGLRGKSTQQVRLQTMQLEEVVDYFDAYGAVKARTVSLISAKIGGYIRSIHVREGQTVRAGQVLIEIDSPELRSQYSKAEAGVSEALEGRREIDHTLLASQAELKASEARMRLAKATYLRFKSLLEKESVTRQEFDETEARYQTARARVESTKEKHNALLAQKQQADARIRQAKSEAAISQSYLGYLTLKAPYAGLVVKRHVDPGTLASPGLPLITLEGIRDLQLEVSVPESFRWKIVTSRPIMARVEAAGIDEVPTEPVEVVAAADPNTRSFTFKLALPPSDLLRSGMFGRARFPVGIRRALQVAPENIIRRGQIDGVFVRGSDNRAQWRLVKLGRRRNGRVEILGGLNADDRVVRNPPQTLAAGDFLEVKP